MVYTPFIQYIACSGDSRDILKLKWILPELKEMISSFRLKLRVFKYLGHLPPLPPPHLSQRQSPQG